jgi:flagellar assembly protein FliH
VVDVVRGALRCLVDRERVTVQVNTLDLELVRDAVEPLVATLGGIEHFEVQEERRVSRGGATVRSAAGEVDATIETKLERAREALVQELKQ